MIWKFFSYNFSIKSQQIKNKNNKHYGSLEEIYTTIDQQNHYLKFQSKHLIRGEGNANSNIMFIGDAPGEAEDNSGKPFIGKSGQFLRIVITKLKLENIYISNILKYRPPENRTPSIDEIKYFRPFLLEEIRLINPKLIICLGKTSSIGVLDMPHITPLKQLRNITHHLNYENNQYPVVCTYHPSYMILCKTKENIEMFINDIKCNVLHN